jgi:hypothetical protein
MWAFLAVTYVIGVVLTGLTLYRTRLFREAHLVNAGATLFWPVYWGLYLTTLFMNRSRG